MIFKKVRRGVVFLAIAGSVQPAFSHGGHHHDHASVVVEAGSAGSKDAGDEKRKAALQAANAGYLRSVKPIFAAKCMDCHSSSTAYPWYYRVPGIKQWIDKDISEGRTHLDLSRDFPFQGHGSVEEDLDAIREVLHRESMPPVEYRLMHAGSKVTAAERKIIEDWIAKAEAALNMAR